MQNEQVAYRITCSNSMKNTHLGAVPGGIECSDDSDELYRRRHVQKKMATEGKGEGALREHRIRNDVLGRPSSRLVLSA